MPAALAHLPKLAKIDSAVLAGKTYRPSMAILLCNPANAVVGAVVCRELPILLDQETHFLRKERVAHGILRPACRRMAKVFGHQRSPPVIGAIGFIGSIGFMGSMLFSCPCFGSRAFTPRARQGLNGIC